MRFEIARWGERGDLNLDPFVVILAIALPLLVFLTIRLSSRRASRVSNRERALSAILLPDGSRSLAIAHCGGLMRLGMTASGVERRRGLQRNDKAREEATRKWKKRLYRNGERIDLTGFSISRSVLSRAQAAFEQQAAACDDVLCATKETRFVWESNVAICGRTKN